MAFLRRFVLYLKEKLGVNQVETENPTTFLAHLQERLNIDGQAFALVTLLYRWRAGKGLGGRGVGLGVDLPILW